MIASQYLSPRVRRVLAIAAFVAVPLGFAAHTARDGARAIDASDAAAARGDLDGAIVQARRAATDDVPLLGQQDDGYDRLETIARAAEARHDEDHALKAWSAEHTAALATSGLRKHTARLTTSSAALAHLYKVRSEDATTDTTRTPIDEAKLAADLSRDETPIGRALALGLATAAVGAGVLALLWASRRRARRAANTAETT